MQLVAKKVNRVTLFFPVLLLSALLVACSDSTEEPSMDDDQTIVVRPGLSVFIDDGSPVENIFSPWLGVVRMFRNPAAPEFNDLRVELLQYDVDLPFSTAIDFYRPDLDTCRINDLDDTGGDGGGNDDNSSVSGGESVTVNSGNGPWLVIPRPNTDNPGFYSALVGDLVLPTDATLSIPGDGFPNVAAYPLLNEPPSPIRITPLAGFLNDAEINAPFRWEPVSDLPGSYIEIDGRAYDSDGNFEGFAVVCHVVDDGEFSLPQDVIALFSDPNRLFDVRYERVVARLDFMNGIMFYQDLTIAE